eukprot:TRINITY_DN3374_c0_g1_i1.p1 TRINITY_DN3374_c0_g1~~TRINITY_DN3374_c0_g1_i1.p1  ORF type:complete len:566 (-),score=181.56 TRINITY_DN3374_c0_g1_i1:1235-2932(-)
MIYIKLLQFNRITFPNRLQQQQQLIPVLHSFNSSSFSIKNGIQSSFFNDHLKRRIQSNNNKGREEEGKGGTVRTRYAPSPTGSLHLGGLRTALYNYMFAKKHKGQFLLRIEDTDKSRQVEGSIQEIIDDLHWANLDYDQGPFKSSSSPSSSSSLPDCGPFVQSERIELYRKYSQELLNNEHAYHCFCSSERLNSIRERAVKKGIPSLYDRHCLSLSKSEIEKELKNNKPFTIRMKIPDGITQFEDQVAGSLSFRNSTIDDQIIIKSDGFPTYHFANVVDDHFMKISHVIRGAEWITSTPKHIILYEMFGWQKPTFAHLPLLTNIDKSKLSKRQGDASVGYYRKAGYLPQAMVNFVSFLGWTPPSNREILSIDEMIEEFTLERVHKAPAVVSLQKLNWINEQYIRKISEGDSTHLLNDLKQQLPKEILENPIYSDTYLSKVIDCLQKRIILLKEIPEKHDYFFKDPVVQKDKFYEKIASNENRDMLKQFSKEFESLSDKDWNKQSITQIAEKVGNSVGKSLTQTLLPLRFAITGTQVGGGMIETLDVLGKEVVNRRLNQALTLFSE